MYFARRKTIAVPGKSVPPLVFDASVMFINSVVFTVGYHSLPTITFLRTQSYVMTMVIIRGMWKESIARVCVGQIFVEKCCINCLILPVDSSEFVFAYAILDSFSPLDR